jgi:hypothetical protein
MRDREVFAGPDLRRHRLRGDLKCAAIGRPEKNNVKYRKGRNALPDVRKSQLAEHGQ